ncbi:MAG: lysoplasmalogenase [Clostridiales bacterium]|nr:lysoplasmalogenase [Clostridiales bacterium]
MRKDLIMNLCVLILMTATGICYQVGGEKKWFSKRTLLFFKGLTTLLASALAVYAYTQTGQTYALILAIGIAVCALADVMLEINFLAGMGVFAAGHVIYIISFWMRNPPRLPSLFLFLALLALVTFVRQRVRKRVDFSTLPHFAYALLISSMVSVAMAQPVLTFIGAVLFVVSDGIIARRLIFPDKNPWDRACILLYYSAQFLLAASLLP